MNLLIFGSSITWGAWDEAGGWAQRIKSFADKKAVATNYNEYTSVYCLGVDGDNTKKLLFRFDTEVKARLGDEKTVILIEIGINDSQFVLAENVHRISPEKYKQNLLALIEKAKGHGADIMFVGLTPVEDEKVDPISWKPSCSYRMEFVRKYDEIVKNTCEEQKILFIGLLPVFKNIDGKDVLIDGLHPNTKGHEIMYETVKSYLLEKRLL